MILITLSMSVLIVLTLFSVIAGANWALVGTNPSLRGSGIQSIEVAGSFQIDELTGAIGIIIVIVVIAVLFGIRLLNSGLSETSVKSLTIGVSYVGLWILFSVFAQPLLMEIQIFGLFLYIVLTIMFAIGVLQKISGVVS